MPTDREILIVGGTCDRSVDVGELSAAFLVPCPDLGRGVVGAVIHSGSPSGWPQSSKLHGSIGLRTLAAACSASQGIRHFRCRVRGVAGPGTAGTNTIRT